MTIATSRCLAVAILVAFAAPAHAQIAEAEALFREGKRLMKEGNTAEACEKFEASDRLDSTTGSQLNLADCREKNGQLATAWALFVKAAATAKHSDTDGKREAEARRRAAALESRLVHLRLVVPDDSAIDGLVIKRNEVVVDPAEWNQRVPIDPGRYTLTAEAPGYDAWESKIVIGDSDKKVEIPKLDKSEQKPVKKHKRVERSEPDDDEGATPAPAPGMSGRRKAAIVVGALGVAAGGAAIALGIHANNLESQSDQLCPQVQCTNSHGVDLNKTARTDGLIANIGFGVGGAAVIGAAVLWLTGGAHHAETVSITTTGGLGLAVGGRF